MKDDPATIAAQTLDTRGEVSQGDREWARAFLMGGELSFNETDLADAFARRRLAALSSTDQRAEERERCAKVANELLSVAEAMRYAVGSGSGMAWMSAAEAEGFAWRIEDLAASIRLPSPPVEADPSKGTQP